jgi:phosphate transport system permease protein
MNAAAVGISIVAVVGVLALIAVKGFAHFWPSNVQTITYEDLDGAARSVFGELVELDAISTQQFLESGGNPDWVQEGQEELSRWLVKTGNRRRNPPDFRWLFIDQIQSMELDAKVAVLERIEWGNAYGIPVELELSERSYTGESVWAELTAAVDRAAEIRGRIDTIEQGSLNRINYELERLRLERRGLALRASDVSGELERIDREEADLMSSYEIEETELRALYQDLRQGRVELRDASGERISVEISDILHLWRPNDMSTMAKIGHYGASIWRFLSEDPREANTEGGIFPAIFGTVLMVLLMSVMVTPFGVIAAVYLREYAKQGPFVRIIRIAVNNLAGVPSIVYGVFGLGFFVYFLGGNLDRLFFPEALPAPTFGTPGLVWASLTLALLTVPVVIVSTEEGLTRIPRSLREGSLALGATQAETLFKVVLPMASPSILTGVILAVARAAGEVAPLMLVGVVKLAPTLPLDANFPFLHLERKFMHLGFHIYDVGFQSPNVEAARPLVYATALLLVTIIVVLNLTAITLRGRLERRYRGVES